MLKHYERNPGHNIENDNQVFQIKSIALSQQSSFVARFAKLVNKDHIKM